MNFTDNNPLSMTGEDSFTSINQILQRCVLIDTNQTILSSKIFEATTTTTFDGDVELKSTTDNTGVLNNTGTLIVGGTLNLNTDIVADKPSLNFTNTGSTIINPQNIMALQIAGTDKFVTDMMNTAIYATSALNLSAGGLNTIQMTSATFQSNFSTQQLFSVNSNQKLQLQNTNTNLNNTTTSIQSGGTTKIQVGASNTALNNTSTNIQSGGTNKIVVDGTTTAMNNTNTNIQSGGTDRVTINATGTTLNNDTTKIQSGGIDKIDLSSTHTYLTNTAGLSMVSNGTGGVYVDPTYSVFQNTAQYLKDVNGVNRLELSTASLLTTNPIATHTYETSHTIDYGGGITSLTMLPLAMGLVVNSVTKEAVTMTDTTLSNTTISLRDGQGTPVTRFTQNNGTTTIRNATINLNDNTPTTRFAQTNGSTTITNTNIVLTGTDIALTGTTGALALTTTTGKASIISTTGQIELKTAGTSVTSINIENTSATTGGITMKTSGTSGIAITSTSATGDIILESGDNLNLRTTNTAGDILITSSNADVDITCGSTKEIKFVVGSTTEGGINSKGTFGTSFFVGDLTTYYPVCFTIVLMQKTFNTSSLTDLDFGYRINNDSGNTCNRFMHPFPYVIVGYSVVADDDANNTTFQVFFTKYSATAQDTAVATDFQSFNSGGFTATIRSTSGSFTEAIYLSDTYRIAPTQCLGAKIDDSSATNNEKTIILHCRQRA